MLIYRKKRSEENPQLTKLPMKKSLFLFIFLLCIVGVFAQKHRQRKSDSLLTVLKSAREDTSKVNTLIALAYETSLTNPDTGLYFANKALVLATNLKDELEIADAHLVIGRVLIYSGKYREALKHYTDALPLCENLLNSASTSYKSKILKRKGNAYNSIGGINLQLGNYPEASQNLFIALGIFQEIGNKKGTGYVYNNLGNIYHHLGNYPEALKNYLSALKIQEEIGDKPNIAGSYDNIGAIYMAQDNFSEALKNYTTALKIYEELDDKRGIAESYTNIGSIYNDEGNHAEALTKFFAALKLEREFDDKTGEAVDLNNIGTVYFTQGNFAEALKSLTIALKINEETGDKQQVAYTSISIGNTYLKMHKNKEASVYLKKGLLLAREVGSLNDIKNAYQSLADLDSAQGNFKHSLENYKMFSIYRDSLINKKNLTKTVQIQMQYEFDKKESLAKAEQEKKDALAMKELQRQKLIRNGFVGGFALLLIFAGVFATIFIQRRELRLVKKERNRISRELHDDIGAELSRITWISQHLQKETNHDALMQEKLRKISDAGKKVLGSIGEIIWTMNPQKNNLGSLFAYIRRYVTEYLEMNGIEVSIDFPEEIPANSVSDEYRRNIFLVIKEAIYNITKYSEATRVRISLSIRKKMADFEISDNGKGFSVEEKQNWGNGLTNMNQRMNDIRGNFQIRSEPNKGTFIKLTFPMR
jgi:signal transduction histidine kinase